jgi:putative ABC transport system permease protein
MTLGSLGQDIRQGWRVLRGDPAFTLVALATLALGIGANAAMFSVIDGVLLKAVPFPEASRLVVVDEYRQEHGSRTVSWMDYRDWRDQNRVFDDLAAYRLSTVTLTGGREPALLRAAEVSAPFFRLLGAPPARGRLFEDRDDRAGSPRTVVVSHALWLSRLNGSPDAIGRAIDVNGFPFVVIGVLPPAFDFFGVPVDVYLPVGLHGDDPEWLRRGNHPDLLVLARLRHGVSLPSARAAFDVLMKRLEVQYAASNAGLGATMVTLYESRYGKTRTILGALLGAVGCLLLIASANVANLLLARSSARRKEIGIRAALGASRWRLVRQTLVESVMLSLGGGALGLCLAVALLPVVLAAAPPGIAAMATLSPDPAVLTFTCAVSIATGLLFGCAPALHAAAGSLASAVHDTGRSGGASRGGVRIRSTLLVAEMAIALVLLTSGALVLRSLANATRASPGFQPEHRLTLDVTIPPVTYQDPARKVLLLTHAVERLRTLPAVAAAGGAQCPPVARVCVDTAFTLADRPVTSVIDIPTAASNIVTPGYFEAMGVPLISGRLFSTADGVQSQPVAIVNRAFVRRHWPGESGVGKQIREGGPQGRQPYRTIVGVVGDIRQSGLDVDARPEVFLPLGQFPFAPWTELQGMTLVVRTDADPASVAADAKQELLSVDKDLPVTGIRTMEARLAESLERRSFATKLLATFALLALLVAAIGVYGVMAYNVNQRRHEIAVRMALGATPGAIRSLVLRGALALAALGVLAGWAASAGVARLLSGLLVGVGPTDPATFATVAATLLSVSVLASLVPIARASAIDPAAVARDN